MSWESDISKTKKALDALRHMPRPEIQTADFKNRMAALSTRINEILGDGLANSILMSMASGAVGRAVQQARVDLVDYERRLRQMKTPPIVYFDEVASFTDTDFEKLKKHAGKADGDGKSES